MSRTKQVRFVYLPDWTTGKFKVNPVGWSGDKIEICLVDSERRTNVLQLNKENAEYLLKCLGDIIK